MSNTFVKYPKRGDIYVKDISTKSPHFIDLDSFVLADLDQTVYEIVGVVYYRKGKKVGVVYKNNMTKQWCVRYALKLTGYTLDGAEHTGILSVRDSSSASANTDYTVTYTASTMQELCDVLNAYFQATTTFKNQDWYAEVVDDSYINVHFSYTFWQQISYNTGKSGFTMTANLLPDYPELSNMRRKHGGNGGEGAISNKRIALTYFNSDFSSTTYNPSSDVTDIKRGYPICKPGYLGTSSYQSDHCSYLRNIYGEGDEGWNKFMESCMLVYTTDWGNMGINNGKERTAFLAGKTYSSSTKTKETLCTAAYYCYNIASTTVNAGEFWLPTTREISMIFDGVVYGSESSRTADELNKGLYLIGGTGISNKNNTWSVMRFATGYSWCVNGTMGIHSRSYMYSSCYTIPVSLIEIE